MVLVINVVFNVLDKLLERVIALENIAVSLYDESPVTQIENMIIDYNVWKIKKDTSVDTYFMDEKHEYHNQSRQTIDDSDDFDVIDIGDVFEHAKTRCGNISSR